MINACIILSIMILGILLYRNYLKSDDVEDAVMNIAALLFNGGLMAIIIIIIVLIFKLST